MSKTVETTKQKFYETMRNLVESGGTFVFCAINGCASITEYQGEMERLLKFAVEQDTNYSQVKLQPESLFKEVPNA